MTADRANTAREALAHAPGLAHALLDHQLVDVDGRRCGNVDDVVLELGDEGAWRVAGILTGPGALAERMSRRPMRWLAQLSGRRCTYIDCSLVARVDSAAHLGCDAATFELDTGERRARGLLLRIMGRDDAETHRHAPEATSHAPAPHGDAHIRLSQLLGGPIHTAGGRRVGCVRDLLVTHAERPASDAQGLHWQVDEVAVGAGGLAARFGWRGSARTLSTARLQPSADGLLVDNASFAQGPT